MSHVDILTLFLALDVHIFEPEFCYNTIMENLTPEQQIVQMQEDYDKRRQTHAEIEPEHESMSYVVEDKIKQQEPAFNASSHAPKSMDGLLDESDTTKVKEWVN